MYEEDSFHTLTASGQVGLVIVSAVLSAFTLWAAWRVMGKGGLLPRLGIALVIFALFVWLSPQMYYLYYLTLFDGLPWQVVVKHPPGFTALADLLLLRSGQVLSAHALAVLGWALLAMAVFRRRGAAAPAQDDRA